MCIRDRGYSGAVLVVSHDRYFLDNICTRIWEVSFQTMTTYKGNFSAYLPQKEAADALRQKQHDADVALAEKLQDYVDRNLEMCIRDRHITAQAVAHHQHMLTVLHAQRTERRDVYKRQVEARTRLRST